MFFFGDAQCDTSTNDDYSDSRTVEDIRRC